MKSLEEKSDFGGLRSAHTIAESENHSSQLIQDKYVMVSIGFWPVSRSSGSSGIS